MNVETIMVYLAVALALSEALSLIPALKANGILEMVIKILSALVKKKPELK